MNDTPASVRLFAKSMAMQDTLDKVGIKGSPVDLAFVKPSQKARNAALWEKYRQDYSVIKHDHHNLEHLQDELWCEYLIARMDLVVECLRENGWNI